MSPLVSIIIPVYNGSNYVKKAIDSALGQTYKNIEILVINDGSKDNTEEIVLSYGDKVRYFKKENGGVSSALNLGIMEMKGEYFSWLSHDDEYSPKKVENQIRALDRYNDNQLICLCAGIAIDKNSKPFKEKSKHRFSMERIYSWEEALLSILKDGAFGGCNLLIPKSVFDKVGNFNEALRYAQDALMWSQIFCCGYSLFYNADEDVYTRIHNSQLTQTGKEIFRFDSIKIAEILLPKYLELSTMEYNFLYYFGYRNARNNIKAVVKEVIDIGKKEKKLTSLQIFKLKLTSIYGAIRPTIRRIYYKLFRKVKTC